MKARIGRAGKPSRDFYEDRLSANTLNYRGKKAEVVSGRRAGVSTDMAAKLKVLERENRELRQANEILRKASAYFALSVMVAFIDDHWGMHSAELIGSVLTIGFVVLIGKGIFR